MENYFEKIKESLKKLISIPSVQGEPKENMPFGEGVYNALNFTLSLAESLGFKTVNYDNYIGEAVYGDGEEEMAILCHLDVVPVGKESDWTYPPFSATEADGKIYGRGATDDKGPAIVCLYCMKALKDEGFLPKKKIKLIFGCNEESGWGCINHYNKVAKMPEFGFSPDADFPVIYAEKGIIHVKFLFDKGGVEDIRGGEAVNMVCDKCEAVAEYFPDVAKKYGVKLSESGKLLTVGRTAHGSTPEKGVNAIEIMLNYLTETNLTDDKIKKYLFLDELSLKEISDETGKLTLSPNVIRMENDKIAVIADIRFPATKTSDEILEKLNFAPYEILSLQKPLYNDKNSFLIRTLSEIYNEVTGENKEPIAIGGGTYARALKLGAGFGPETEDFKIHQPNEFVSEENLKLQFTIYKKAIKKLSE